MEKELFELVEELSQQEHKNMQIEDVSIIGIEYRVYHDKGICFNVYEEYWDDNGVNYGFFSGFEGFPEITVREAYNILTEK